MTRKDKVQILSAIAAGKANVYDLAAGDGWFIKAGGFYIGEGIRYTPIQFEKIKSALKKQGREWNGIDTGDNPTARAFVLKYTKASNI